MKQILKSTFWQLMAIYTVLIILISLELFWKFTLHFEIFAVILAVLGIIVISKTDVKELENKKLHYSLFIFALLLIFITRAIPYINNSVPLGYDTGLYKYGIEHGLQNLDHWIMQGGMEPGFLYLMEFFKLFFSTQFILTWLFIIFNMVLGVSIYFFTKEYFNKKAALIALFLYALSVVQFQVFAFMYYKNIIALSFMLFSLYFLKKGKKWPFIILAGLTGAIHRPTFYILGLSYFIYAFVEPYKDKKYNTKKLLDNILLGIFILIIFSLFYIGKFRPAILSMFEPVLNAFFQSGESPGTFINLFTYQFATLAYLPFAILGFFYLIKEKKFNMLFFWALINAIIVYFQFFFFNRFIIHLDIALIILASAGFMLIIENKKRLGILITILMLFSIWVVTFNESRNIPPLIDKEELFIIGLLNNTEKDAFVMSTSSYYSPWLQGYSGRGVIAPGLFDYDKQNQSEWIKFWTTSNLNETQDFLSVYGKPLYIFIGEHQTLNEEKFNNSCFEAFFKSNNTKIYEYKC